MNIFVEIVLGPEKGRTIQLADDQLLRVGRGRIADVALPLDKSMSSIHFLLEGTKQACHLKDLGSRNGTFLNGRKVTEAVLKTGDEIRAGHTTFAVSIHEAVVPTSLSAQSRVPHARDSGSVQATVIGRTSQETAALTMALNAPAATPDPPVPSMAVGTDARPSRRVRSPRRFHVELYEEHLEEASFLYAQRLTLFEDAELAWTDIAEFEERLEAHIDALVIGDNLALEVCETHASEGDFGELFAAVCVFCRQQRFDLVRKVLEPLDPGDPEKLRAMADALKYECPSEWQSELEGVLPADDPRLLFVLAILSGYRRIKGVERWGSGCETLAPPVAHAVAWSLGRIGGAQAEVLLPQWVAHEDEAVRTAAILALLRLGDDQILGNCMRDADTRPVPWSTLAIGASRSLVNVLLTRVARDKPKTDELLALGILGDVGAVPVLMALLSDDMLAAQASMGLNLITGAELYEKAFIPEEIDEDELFEEEKESVKQGKPLLRPDGKPFGETVVRLSQKPDDWQKWWSANQTRFDSRLRYRGGKPYSPASVVETLQNEKSPRQVRQLAYEELVIRYGVDFPFETDMFVPEQKHALAKYEQWAKANGSGFQTGGWYFAGKVLGT